MSYEFKFVVDGELDERAQALVAKAVAEAGSRALVELVQIDRDVLEIDLSRIRDWEWVGRVALLDKRALEVATNIKDIVRL